MIHSYIEIQDIYDIGLVPNMITDYNYSQEYSYSYYVID